MNLSIFKTITAERMKLKRSPVWLAFFALPILSAFFGTFNYMNNRGVLQNEWYSLWTQHSLFLCYLFMPALIGTYCSYLWRLEHMRNNWNSFLTAPVPLSALYLGKLFQAVVMIIAGNAWIFLLYFLCGKFCGLPGYIPKESAGWFLCGIVGGIAICCIQLAVSMLIRSFAVPIGVSLAGSIGGLVMTNQGWGLYYPYSLYSLGMRANNPQRALDIKVFTISSILYIVLFSAISVYALRKHSS
ncbi:MAG: ABC transporter permease [Bacillus sp. (in: Bacteria)]|nr:ABC transporter permease [Bacillus sp. (in: firmicutes)]MCM1425187.1 ABC transporter permease [Eubacterium sp.]